ncbi:MAG: hypothetical protein LAO04_16745 [Acidobacteriia bacterium]|nr:hypothetical protein [Terriglobia bacterium]
MAVTFSENDMTGPQTHAESARVEGGYESLDVNSTKKAFEDLNGVLDRLATTVVQTLDQMVPYLAKMQSLLSQRGADRKKVLQQAGLPGWMHWAKAYASKLDRSLRTIQDRIKQFRETRACGTSKTKSGSNGERVRLDSRQQGALVKAQLAANDLVAALENDGDWQTALATYRKVAVSPEKLDSFVNALNPEPDWKGILAELANTLERCGDRLPIPARNALRTVQKLLGGKPDQQQLPSGIAKAAVTKQNRVQKHRRDGSTCCALPGEEMPSEDARKPPASAKVTACLPVRGPEEECEHETLDATHVQRPAPAAKGRESTPPEKSANYRLRKAKAQREYYRRKKEAQLAVRAATPAAPQEAGPQGMACQDAPQPAATPTPKRGTSKEARKPPAPVKTKVGSPALSPEEEERKHGTLGAASNHPGRRQGDFVLKENGIWECEPELGMGEAEEILNAQPGEQQTPRRKPMETAAKPYRVKPRTKPGFKTDYLIVCDGDKQPCEVFDTESEAKAACESLNKSLVANIVPQHTNPQSAVQPAAY